MKQPRSEIQGLSGVVAGLLAWRDGLLRLGRVIHSSQNLYEKIDWYDGMENPEIFASARFHPQRPERAQRIDLAF